MFKDVGGKLLTSPTASSASPIIKALRGKLGLEEGEPGRTKSEGA